MYHHMAKNLKLVAYFSRFQHPKILFVKTKKFDRIKQFK